MQEVVCAKEKEPCNLSLPLSLSLTDLISSGFSLDEVLIRLIIPTISGVVGDVCAVKDPESAHA